MEMEFIHFKDLLFFFLKETNNKFVLCEHQGPFFKVKVRASENVSWCDYIRQCVDSKLGVGMVSADGSLRRIENQRVDHPQNVIKQYMRNCNDPIHWGQKPRQFLNPSLKSSLPEDNGLR